MVHTTWSTFLELENDLFQFRMHTEIWDENFVNGEVSKHYLKNSDYVYEAALFLVDKDFCKQNIVHHVDPELGSGQFPDNMDFFV